MYGDLLPLSGCLFKLYSDDDIVGIVMLPEHFVEKLQRFSVVDFAYIDRMTPLLYVPDAPGEFDRSIKRMYFSRARGDDNHGVQLFGGDPECLEKIPGFSFYPGSAYIRRMIVQALKDEKSIP